MVLIGNTMPLSYVLRPEDLDYTYAQKGRDFGIESLSVEFTTTAEFVASVLPPCFEPADEPTGLVVVSNYRRDDGPGRPKMEFDMTSVYLDATYNGIAGQYSLMMLISDDMPVTNGREKLGEIKKHGESRMYFDGREIYAYGRRKGTRVVEVSAQLGADTGPSSAQYRGLELKASPTPDLQDFHVKPTVVVMGNTDQYTVTRKGTCTDLQFRSNGKYDPVESIPLVSTGSASYTAGRSHFECELWEPVPDVGPEYMAIVLGRQYDFGRVS